ncbi:TPA: hypothetical protein ACOEHG_004898 [Enterobacter ludwigii]
MTSIPEFLNKLDYDQIKYCRDECDRRINAVEAEEKKVAWAVTDGAINFGWFRTEDYPKAVECLASSAAERWEEADKEKPKTHYELNISIEGTRLPLSEYEKLFADGEWG